MSQFGLGSATLDFVVNEAAMTSALSRVQATMGRLQQTMLGVSARAKVLFLDLAGAIKGWVGNASEAEDAAAKLDAALAAQGNTAGVSSDEIKGIASDLQNVTKFEDDATVAASAMLARFNNIKGDIFKDAIKSGANLATALGTDMQGALGILSRALSDPVRGMKQLRRAGVQFTAGQQEFIKQQVAVGNVAAAQREILNQVERQYNGVAEAAGKTLSGRLAILQNKWGDLTEQLGGLFIPILERIIPVVQSVVQVISEWVAAHPNLATGIALVGTALLGLIALFGPLSTGIAVVGAAMSFLAANPIVLLIAGITALVGWLAYALIPGDDFGQKMQWIGSTLNNVGSIIMGALRSALEWLKNMWFGLQVEAANFGDRTRVAFLTVARYAVTAFDTIRYYLVEHLPESFTNAIEFMRTTLLNWFNWTVSVFTNLGTNMRNFFAAVVSGVTGQGFQFDWTPLTQGFQEATANYVPIAERALTDTEVALDAGIDAINTNIAKREETMLRDRLAEQHRIEVEAAKKRGEAAADAHAKATGAPTVPPPQEASKAPKPGKTPKDAAGDKKPETITDANEIFKRFQQAAFAPVQLPEAGKDAVAQAQLTEQQKIAKNSEATAKGVDRLVQAASGVGA